MAKELIYKLAGCFQGQGTICLHIPNDVLYPVLVLAIMAAGCRWTGTNIANTHHELRHHLETSECGYVITPPEYVETVRMASVGLRFDVRIVVFSDILREALPGDNATVAHQTLHQLLAAHSTELESRLLGISLDDVAMLQSTSGTTGLPKMAARTHRSMILESKAIEDNNDEKPWPVRRLYCTPIFHAFTTPEVIVNVLRLGHPTYVMKRFDQTFAKKVHEFQISEIAAPPAMLRILTEQKESRPLLESVHAIYTGGASLSRELEHQVSETFVALPNIVPVWGMTEGGWFTTFKYPDLSGRSGSVGKAVPGYEIKVDQTIAFTAEDGKQAGELLVRGPQLMTGYLNNPEATEQAFSDGWLRTGDVGSVDEEGRIFVIDRVKDLIKINGWQVAPAEIEHALLEHSNVSDVAAVSAGWGVDEYPLVFVVEREAMLTVEDVIGFLKGRLARHKVATAKIVLTSEIPRSASGKILRRDLKEQGRDRGFLV